MKRPRFGARTRASREATQLCWLAEGLAKSSGKLEDRFWESRLAAQVDEALHHGGEDDLNAALDRLFEANPPAHDELADMIEARAETTVLTQGDQAWDILLIAVPLLAWSRYAIGAGTLPGNALAAFKAQLSGHVLAADARLALCDYLFSPDQLPRSFVDTHLLTAELGARALVGTDLSIDASGLPETNRFLSDTRYLLGAIAVPQGAPLFRWHERDGSRETALEQWVKQGGQSFEPLLPGCAYQPLLADAYHAACRQADRASRPYALQASVAFLQTAFETSPDALRAVIGPCWDQRLEEYRIGFSMRDKNNVIHGVVWPILGSEEEHADVAHEIETLLRQAGIGEVAILDHRLPLEFCDDCGVPLYPNLDAEMVHAELPEEHSAQAPRLLH